MTTPPASGHPVAVTAALGSHNYRVELRARGFRFTADEPPDLGGGDTAPTPGELLAGALASCTAVTVRMYADRKGWPLAGVFVAVRYVEGGAERRMQCAVRVDGNLDAEQRARLVEIAGRCPVHRLLEAGVEVDTVADGDA